MADNHSTSASEWIRILRKNGFRATASMRTVIHVIQESHKALSIGEIHKASRKHSPRIGLATVYRVLERLDRLGLVERVHHTEYGQWYLAAANGHEHLLLCTSCRKAEYFHGDNLSELVTRISTRSGYRIHGHWLQLHGLCTTCRKKGD